MMVGDNLARKMRRGIQFYCGEDGGEKRRVVENVQKRPEATRRDATTTATTVDSDGGVTVR